MEADAQAAGVRGRGHLGAAVAERAFDIGLCLSSGSAMTTRRISIE
jgi:hypothetical protein